MPLSDLLVLSSLPVFTTLFAVLMWRRGARGRRLFAATWLAFFGFVVTNTMIAHSIETGYHTIAGGMSFTGVAWTFDFRAYSLQLLGAVLMWQGVRSIWAAFRMALGDAQALRTAFLSMGIVLAVVAPLIWVHAFFGYLLTVITAASMLAVGGGAWEKKQEMVAA